MSAIRCSSAQIFETAILPLSPLHPGLCLCLRRSALTQTNGTLGLCNSPCAVTKPATVHTVSGRSAAAQNSECTEDWPGLSRSP